MESINEIWQKAKQLEDLRERTWLKILENNPSDKALFYILKNVESLRERAWVELLKRDLIKV